MSVVTNEMGAIAFTNRPDGSQVGTKSSVDSAHIMDRLLDHWQLLVTLDDGQVSMVLMVISKS